MVILGLTLGDMGGTIHSTSLVEILTRDGRKPHKSVFCCPLQAHFTKRAGKTCVDRDSTLTFWQMTKMEGKISCNFLVPPGKGLVVLRCLLLAFCFVFPLFFFSTQHGVNRVFVVVQVRCDNSTVGTCTKLWCQQMLCKPGHESSFKESGRGLCCC